MKRQIAVSCFLAAACCWSPHLSAQERKDGNWIGQVVPGMSQEEVEKLIGKPTDCDAAMGKAVETWTAKQADERTEQTQAAIRWDESGQHWKVVQIAITSPFFHTRGGNSTNSDLGAIWREFFGLRFIADNINGRGSDLEFYDDTTLNIAILIERTNPLLTGVGAPPEQAAGG